MDSVQIGQESGAATVGGRYGTGQGQGKQGDYGERNDEDDHKASLGSDHVSASAGPNNEPLRLMHLAGP
jgi:hypothetical protein